MQKCVQAMLTKPQLMQLMCNWQSSIVLTCLSLLLPQKIFLLDIAGQRNQTPLPLTKPYSGPWLPPDRYCFITPKYTLKSLPKKASTSVERKTVPWLSVGWITRRLSAPTLGTTTAQTMSISTKVGTPMCLTRQRFTIQMPTSQSPAAKASILPTSAVQNVLVNLLIGSKKFLLPLTWCHHKILPINHQMHWKENMQMMMMVTLTTVIITCNLALMHHVTCELDLESYWD